MRIIFTILISVISVSIFGQESTILNAKPERTDFIRYDSLKRRSLFPFSKAKQIKIVSFHWQKDTIRGRPVIIYKIPLSHDTVDQSKLDQVLALNQLEIDSLTDILYNECSRWTMSEMTEIMCYVPRNAIVFYDQNDKPFEYIEICFECHGYGRSNGLIKSPDRCDLMFARLQEFFAKHGLKTKASQFPKEINATNN